MKSGGEGGGSKKMTSPQPVRKNRAWLVVSILFGLSVAIGLVAYWRFIVSDKYLRADLHRLGEQGKKLDVEGCVDATLEWARHCKAMKSLCDATTPEMMGKCLAARDRSAYCKKLGDTGKDTHYGYKECKARGVTRKTKKTCSIAYRAIVTHCENRVARRDHRP